MGDLRQEKEEIQKWIMKLPGSEKDNILARLIAGEDPVLTTELFQRFIKEREAKGLRPNEQTKMRTIGELLRATQEHTEQQRQLAARKAAEEKARREREAAISRQKHLDKIAGQEPKLWGEVDNLIATKLPKSYDQAVKLLIDLRDLAVRRGKSEEFHGRIDALRAAHSRKPSFIERLRKVGL